MLLVGSQTLLFGSVWIYRLDWSSRWLLRFYTFWYMLHVSCLRRVAFRNFIWIHVLCILMHISESCPFCVCDLHDHYTPICCACGISGCCLYPIESEEVRIWGPENFLDCFHNGNIGHHVHKVGTVACQVILDGFYILIGIPWPPAVFTTDSLNRWFKYCIVYLWKLGTAGSGLGLRIRTSSAIKNLICIW